MVRELYAGRVLFCGGIIYLIIKDDGSDIITTEEMTLAKKLDLWNEDVVINKRELIPTGHYKKFIVEELRNMISSKICWDTYWLQSFN